MRLWLLGLALAIGIQTTASADSAYRYWSYWIAQDGEWQAASAGAASIPVQDEMVQGWHFVQDAAGLSTDSKPDANTEYKTLCPNVEPKAGFARVALVLDYGDLALSELGEKPEDSIHCLEIESGARSIELLFQVAEIREDLGFICGINNFPISGCGEVVSTELESAEKTNSLPAPLSVSIAVFALAIASFLTFLRKFNRKV